MATQGIDQAMVDMTNPISKGPGWVSYPLKDNSTEMFMEIKTSDLLPAHSWPVQNLAASLLNIKHDSILNCRELSKQGSALHLIVQRFDSTLESVLKNYKDKGEIMPVDRIILAAKQIAGALVTFNSAACLDSKGYPIHSHPYWGLRVDNILTDTNCNKFVVSGHCFDSKYSPLPPAPGVHSNKHQSTRDTWNLGCLIWHMATGEAPDFVGDDDPSDVYKDGWSFDEGRIKDDVIKDLLRKLLVPNPEDRPRVQDLSNIIDSVWKKNEELFEHNRLIRDSRRLEEENIRQLAQKNVISRENRYMEYALTPRDPTDPSVIYTKLMRAATEGRLDVVKFLVRYYAGNTDEHGHTALVYAAQAGHREVAEFLMKHEKDVTGWTMLMCAAVLGDTDMISQHLNEKGKRDKQNRTALILAAQNKRDEAVKLLMKHEGNDSGWTSLIYSAYLGDIDAVKDNLHEKGRQDITGMTALMWAVDCDRQDAIDILAEHEAEMQDNSGCTAAIRAQIAKKYEIRDLILKRMAASSGWSMLMCASITGDVELAKQHLVDKDMKDANGDTALDMAIKARNAAIVDLLRPADDNGVTALMQAVIDENMELIKMLIPLQAGRVDNSGRTALRIAYSKNNIEMMKLLCQHERKESAWSMLMLSIILEDRKAVALYSSERYEVNADEDNGISFAVRFGHEDMLEIIDPTSEQGVTALMRAVLHENDIAFRALVSLQAGHSTTDGIFHDDVVFCAGHTALMFAIQRNRLDFALDLIEYELTFVDNDGWTALMHALALTSDEQFLEKLLNEAGGCSINERYIYPVGTTDLMLAASKGLENIVTNLVYTGLGRTDENGNCALVMAMENGHKGCASQLLKELSLINKDNLARYFQLVDTSIDTKNDSFVSCYNILEEAMVDAFSSQMREDLLLRIMQALYYHCEENLYAEDFAGLFDCIFSTLFCESDDALQTLCNCFLSIEEADLDCVVCMSRQRAVVLLPCKHMIICESCLTEINRSPGGFKCPYCRTMINDTVTVFLPVNEGH